MRISSLPTFLTCPSSQMPIANPFDPPSDAAEVGQAVHECLAQHVQGFCPEVSIIARQHQCSVDEVEQLYAFGRIAWGGVREDHPRPVAECRMEAGDITGTADVLSWEPETGSMSKPASLAVLDWKTNRVKRGYRDQLCGYAAAATEVVGWPRSGTVLITLVWLRFREVEQEVITRDMVEDLYERIRRAHKDIGKRFAPGDACTFCRRQLICQARADYLRSACTSMVETTGSDNVSRETLGKLYSRSRQMRRALEHYDRALKLALRDGPVADQDGNILSLDNINVDNIAPDKAWPILRSHGFTDEDLAHCVTIGKTKMLETVGKKHDRGMKGIAKGALMTELREVGAVTQTPQQRIKIDKGNTL